MKNTRTVIRICISFWTGIFETWNGNEGSVKLSLPGTKEDKHRWSIVFASAATHAHVLGPWTQAAWFAVVFVPDRPNQFEFRELIWYTSAMEANAQLPSYHMEMTFVKNQAC